MVPPDYDYGQHLFMVDGELTFCGAHHEYYAYLETDAAGIEKQAGFSKFWKAQSTIDSYRSVYCNVIFPEIDDIPLKKLSYEYFEEIIKRIREKGGRSNKSYSDSRIQVFRRAIKNVIEEACKNGVCEDFLWGSTYSLPPDEEPDKACAAEYVQLRKSLSPFEELAIIEDILTDETQSGEEVGLALMYCEGFRNEEACGLNYADYYEMQKHPGAYCLRCTESTSNGTSELQIGGKTDNMPRVLPTLDALDKFLARRIAFLQKKIDDGTIECKADGTRYTVSELPIACVGHNYLQRCNSGQLTAAGRQLFKRIKLPEKELAYIDNALQSGCYIVDGISVKDPTTYLFRRHLGTILAILGMTEEMIQYIMGHKIENPQYDRNDFSNEDMLIKIKKMLDNRYFLGKLSIDQTINLSGNESSACTSGNTSHVTADITVEGKTEIFATVSAIEPTDTISLRINRSNGADKLSGKVLSMEHAYSPERTININQAIRSYADKAADKYKKVQENLKKKTEKSEE